MRPGRERLTAKQLEKDTVAMLKETGWQVEKAVADADEWCSDEDA